MDVIHNRPNINIVVKADLCTQPGTLVNDVDYFTKEKAESLCDIF